MNGRRALAAICFFAPLAGGAGIPSGARGEVRSAGGGTIARFEPGDVGARRVRVLALEGAAERELWSAAYPAETVGEQHLLTDDGVLVLRALPVLARGSAPLAAYGAASLLHAWSANALHLDAERLFERAPEPRWLVEEPGAARLVRLAQPWGVEDVLILALADGRRLAVDLWGGAVHLAAAAELPTPVRWEPATGARGEGELAYLATLETAELVAEGQPLEISFRGSFPTPGWSFAGFDVDGTLRRSDARFAGGQREIALSLAPRAHPPREGAVLQVLDPFEQRLVLRGLPAGSYVLSALSRGEDTPAALRVDVVPAGMLASLHLTGGIAGFDRTTIVHADGWVEIGGARPTPPDPAAFPLDAERWKALEELLPRLPGSSFAREFEGGADLFHYELAWRAGDELRRVRVDDVTAKDAVRELIILLRGIG